MKKVILIILIVMICTTNCTTSAKSTKNSENDIIQNCLDKYYKFLNGEISANSDDSIKIDDIFYLGENYNKFTCFDSNHNGIPELHLSSMRDYIILECINGTLKVIYSGTGYETLLNNGGILYTRNGGAPEHISHAYTELDSNNNVTKITFEKYNTMNNKKDDDLYLFENKEVSKSEFDKKTKKYLNINSDLIIWSDYWTFLVENAN